MKVSKSGVTPRNLRIDVYKNLHKDLWSVRGARGDIRGVVICHEQEVWLTDAVFRVQELGRQRVLREKRKNVHAYIQGDYTEEKPECDVQVRYNPYEHSTFVTLEGLPVISASAVVLNPSGEVWAKNPKHE